jgi:hypothetical protein
MNENYFIWCFHLSAERWQHFKRHRLIPGPLWASLHVSRKVFTYPWQGVLLMQSVLSVDCAVPTVVREECTACNTHTVWMSKHVQISTIKLQISYLINKLNYMYHYAYSIQLATEFYKNICYVGLAKGKAVSLHAMAAHGGSGGIFPTHS